MFDDLKVYGQYLLPHHLVSAYFGWLARQKTPWLKNYLIRKFIRKYGVDMSQARIENPEAYPTFNDFFIRELNMTLRPMAAASDAIISPVDGSIAQIGQIKRQQLLQAKSFYFNLEALLGGNKTLSDIFTDGSFATLYLAPYDYHRVHMPFAGTLKQAIFVPGRLFSVNRMTSEIIPQIYSRNERLITLFDTEVGKMAVILIGAFIVGSIQTTWMQSPVRFKHLTPLSLPPSPLYFAKGEELGYFKIGSTVLVLFEKNKVAWDASRMANNKVEIGQLLGKTLLLNHKDLCTRQKS